MTLPRSTLAWSVSPSKSVAVTTMLSAPAVRPELSSSNEAVLVCSTARNWVMVTAPVDGSMLTVNAVLPALMPPAVAEVEPTTVPPTL